MTLLRRATFDLTGLPPTPAEIQAFLADTSPQAFEKVVDRLLASPRYGERWGRHWLDVARYADSTGNDEDHRYPYAWRYRDYVIDPSISDLPYDQFVREQIAGDLLPARPTDELNRRGIVATGFLALGAKALAQADKKKMMYDIYDEQVDVTSQALSSGSPWPAPAATTTSSIPSSPRTITRWSRSSPARKHFADRRSARLQAPLRARWCPKSSTPPTEAAGPA